LCSLAQRDIVGPRSIGERISAMGKKARTREKLDVIMSELQKLKSDIRTLARQQADLAAAVDKLIKPAKAAPARPARKRAKPRAKPASAAATRKAASAPKRPTLVPPSTAAG
jgi:septal ring factor EnvC (AmiA/AmiB activator)